MSLIKWKRKDLSPKSFYNPFKEIDNMINQFYTNFFDSTEVTPFREEVSPAFNMYKEGDKLVVEAQVPGYEKKEINVEINDNILTIKGKHKEETKKEDKNYLYQEFQSGSFFRSITLPEGVDIEKLKAKHQDGLIKITMPTPKEYKKSKSITIE